MPPSDSKDKRKQKLRSALRDNLKKRKSQTRKLSTDSHRDGVSLRERELTANRGEKTDNQG